MAALSGRLLLLLTTTLTLAILAASPAAAQLKPSGVKCADEHERCEFSGEATIYYGAGDQWVKRQALNGVDCSNAVFGDPIVGTVKSCYREGGSAVAPRLEKPITRGTVTLRSDSGKFMARCNNCQRTVNGLADTATVHMDSAGPESPWARFEVESLGGDKVALRSDNGKYLARCNGCIAGGANPDALTVHATNPRKEPWAQLTIVPLANGKVALRADSGKFVARCNGCSPGASTPDTVTIHVDDPNKAPWAQWEMTRVQDKTAPALKPRR